VCEPHWPQWLPHDDVEALIVVVVGLPQMLAEGALPVASEPIMRRTPGHHRRARYAAAIMPMPIVAMVCHAIPMVHALQYSDSR